MIVVVKWISSLRNKDATVMTMVENEGKYAFMIMNAGFLFKTNLAIAFDPFLYTWNSGSWILN